MSKGYHWFCSSTVEHLSEIQGVASSTLAKPIYLSYYFLPFILISIFRLYLRTGSLDTLPPYIMGSDRFGSVGGIDPKNG